MQIIDYEGSDYEKITQALSSCSNLKFLKLNKIILCSENSIVNTVAALKNLQVLHLSEMSNGVVKKIC